MADNVTPFWTWFRCPRRWYDVARSDSTSVLYLGLGEVTGQAVIVRHVSPLNRQLDGCFDKLCDSLADTAGDDDISALVPATSHLSLASQSSILKQFKRSAIELRYDTSTLDPSRHSVPTKLVYSVGDTLTIPIHTGSLQPQAGVLNDGDTVAVIIKRKSPKPTAVASGAGGSTPKKTRICELWLKHPKFCRRGDASSFAHGDAQLGSPRAAAGPPAAGGAGATPHPPRDRFFIEEIILLSACPAPDGPASSGAPALQPSAPLPRSATVVLASLDGPAARKLLQRMQQSLSGVMDAAASVVVPAAAAAWGSGSGSGSSSAALHGFGVFLRGLLRVIADGASDAGSSSDAAEAQTAPLDFARLRAAVAPRLVTALMLSRAFRVALSALLASGRSSREDRAAVVHFLRLTLSLAPERFIIASVLPWLQRILTSAGAAAPGRGGPGAFSVDLVELLVALGDRLPAARALGRGARAAIDVSEAAALGLSVDLQRPSHAVPWLRLPLVPTAGDVLSPTGLVDRNLPRLRQLYESSDAYLETLFRLLRADGLQGIVEGVGKLSRGTAVDRRDLQLYHSITVLGFRASGSGLQAVVRFEPVGLRPNVDLEASGKLMEGNLLCASLDGSFATHSLLWATVAPNCGHLLKHGVTLLDLLYDEDRDSFAGLGGVRALLQAGTAGPGGASRVVMAESPAYFTAIRHALVRLQRLGAGMEQRAERESQPVLDEEGDQIRMPHLCLRRELVGLASANPAFRTPPGALDGLEMSTLASHLVSKLDASQRRAVTTALSNRISCTQGPPGTGKTYTSAQLTEMLLTHVEPERRPTTPVLMLAAKNHALDSFLARILPLHPGGVARVGGRSETAEILAVNLGQLRQDAATQLRATRTGPGGARPAARTPAEVELRGAWGAKGKAAQERNAVVDELRGELDALASGDAPLSLQLLVAHLTSEQVGSLITGTGGPLPADVPSAIRRLYEAAVAAAMRQARVDVHWQAVADATGGSGTDWSGSDADGATGASLRSAARGGRILDALKKPLVLPEPPAAAQTRGTRGANQAPVGGDDDDDDDGSGAADDGDGPDAGDCAGWATAGRGGGHSSSLLTPYKALEAAVKAWLVEVDSAEARGMFTAQASSAAGGDLGGSHSLFTVSAAAVAIADGADVGAGSGNGDAADGGSAVALDAEDVAAILEDRHLLDDDDDDGDVAAGDGATGGASAKPPAPKAAGASLVTASAAARAKAPRVAPELAGVLQQDGCKLFDGGQSAPGAAAGDATAKQFARVSFVTHPWSESYAFLGEDPLQVQAIAALADTRQLWALDARQRALLLRNLALAAAEDSGVRRRLLSRRYAAAEAALRSASLDFDAALLCGKKVLGMTITGAAKHAELLERLRPSVVIVEEAAEVAEPLLVAALPSSTKHLYLAGDHKQLPPQPSTHALTRAPFHLNRSLFERLVMGGMPHAALQTQNRMAPTLASLVRALGVYDRYDDRLGIEDRAAPGYLPGHVWWWDHTDPEEGAAGPPGGSGGRGSGGPDGGAAAAGTMDSSSKANTREAQRAAAVAVWHMLNGVHPSRVVVLATYAGQVQAVRTALRALLNGKEDLIDHARRGPPEGAKPTALPGTAAASSSGSVAGATGSGGAASRAPTAAATSGATASATGAAPAIAPGAKHASAKAAGLRPAAADMRAPRVCTVDEYQGDEADHVVLSLTRCNPGREVGYLKEPNRLTVAVSRARHSLVVVGCAAQFAAQRHFTKVVDELNDSGLFGSELPLLCPRHPHIRLANARTAGDVPSTLAGAALCKQRCGGQLACAHPCPKLCHITDASHEQATAACIQPVLYTNPRCKHSRAYRCHLVRGGSKPPCDAPCDLRLPCGHQCAASCGGPCTHPDSCATCIAVKEAQRQAELSQAAARHAMALEAAKRELKRMPPATSDADGVTKVELSLKPVPDVRAQPVIDAIINYAEPGAHGFVLTVERVVEVTAPHLMRGRWDAVQRMASPSTQPHPTLLYHGTLAKNIDGILRHGFKVARTRDGPRASHAANMLGSAVYLAINSTKAARDEYTGGKDGAEGALLVCSAFLGSIKEVADADPSLDAPARRKAELYDSAYMRRNAGVKFDEYAVYEPACVVPRFVVYFRRVAASGSFTHMSRPGADQALTPFRRDGDVKWYRAEAKDFTKLPAFLLTHFSVAQAVFAQLRSVAPGGAAATLTGVVDVKLKAVEVCDNPRLRQKWEDAKQYLEKKRFTETVYTFHGTKEENIYPIQRDGFHIGGVGGAVVSHGVAHGYGVYTGTAADVSEGYTRKGANGVTRLLIVRGLLGNRSANKLTVADCGDGKDVQSCPSHHSFSVTDFAHIFASADLVLPLYVIEW